MRRRNKAAIADLLTISRFGIGVALVPVTWTLTLSQAAWLVSSAWVTDVLDGRLARAAGEQGRLGRWDVTADTLVGAGVLIGLAGSGEVPFLYAAGALVIFGGLFLAGNLAAPMLLQLSGYLPLLAILWTQRPDAWWVPFLVAALIGVVDWRRLLTVNIPNFVRGVAAVVPGRSRRGW